MMSLTRPRDSIPPLVSLVMPIRSEEDAIGENLRRLIGQTYRKDRYEIIIVDGMSEDRTREIVGDYVRRVAGTGGPAIHLLDNPMRSLYPALNIGFKAARGEIIMRVDGRCICPLDYIERCVRTLQETQADNVGGMQVPIGETSLQKAIALAMSHPFGVGNARYRIGRRSGYAEAIYLGCFHRKKLDEIGLFDESRAVLSEDSDINHRIRKAGGKTYLDCTIKVGYLARSTLTDQWNIYLTWGKARASFLRKHRTLTSIRQMVAPLFVASLVALSLLSFLDTAALAATSVLAGAYLLCDLLASLHLAFKAKRLKLLPILLAVFPCMHFAWAFGFWVELLHPSRGGVASWR